MKPTVKSKLGVILGVQQGSYQLDSFQAQGSLLITS